MNVRTICATVPQVIRKFAESTDIAVIFDNEKVTLTYKQINIEVIALFNVSIFYIRLLSIF